MWFFYFLNIFIGIGKEIATYLDAAWKNIVQVHFDGIRPDVKSIKILSPKVAFQYMESLNVSKGRRGVIPFLSRSQNNNNNDDMACSSQTISTSQSTKIQNTQCIDVNGMFFRIFY